MSYPPQQPGQPQPGPPPGYQPPRRRTASLVLALVVGLVVGAGAVALTWQLSSPDDADSDAAAVCGVLERTQVPKDLEGMSEMPEEEYRRWAISEIGPSMAKRDPDLKPLADALGKILPSIQQFDFDAAKKAIVQAKDLCADL